jgi:subfamily B ATP-binding cassette protein MsbA
VTFNVLYALFSSLSMLSLLPMLNIMFGKQEKILVKPVLHSSRIWADTSKIRFPITSRNIRPKTRSWLCCYFADHFAVFLKNLFNYFAMVHITVLRNGVLKDLRNILFKKIIELPISFYSKNAKAMSWRVCWAMWAKYRLRFFLFLSSSSVNR